MDKKLLLALEVHELENGIALVVFRMLVVSEASHELTERVL